MVQQIINAIIPLLITAIVGILGVIIKSLGDALIAFIETKKKEIIVKIGSATYNQNLVFAKSAWNIVDEYFRINSTIEKTIDSAQAKFAEEIKKLVPSITDEEIAFLRQTVAGEVNKGRDVIITPITETKSVESGEEIK